MRYVLLLLLCVTQQASAQMFSADEAWSWACKYSQYDCRGVERPTFIIGMPKGQEHHRGGYSDGVVYMNRYLIPGTDMQSTAVHETVHHLQNVVGGLPMTASWNTPEMEQLCFAESEAFMITDKWWGYVGQSDQRRGENWWVSYPHCYPYYNPDWEPQIWSITIDWLEQQTSR